LKKYISLLEAKVLLMPADIKKAKITVIVIAIAIAIARVQALAILLRSRLTLSIDLDIVFGLTVNFRNLLSALLQLLYSCFTSEHFNKIELFTVAIQSKHDYRALYSLELYFTVETWLVN
jgi:hypothetical protein